MSGLSITISFGDVVHTILTRQKGKSLFEIPSDYTVIDLETTGLSPEINEIIEVACLKFRDHKLIDSFQSLVRPPLTEIYEPNGDIRQGYVNSFITGLTGIDDEMLKNAPTFSDIADKLFAFLENEKIVGHNVNFDINFLYDNFSANGGLIFGNDFIDTLRLARIAIPEMMSHRLCDLTDRFQISTEHHRALADCESTQKVLLKLKDIVSEKEIDLSLYGKGRFDLTALKVKGDNIDTSHIFYDKNCVFTGKLEKFQRKDAAQIVVNIGGHCENNVTAKTNFLIIGGLNCSTIKDGKSAKMKKAEKLILAGQYLQILSENTFYDLIADLI